MAASTVSWRWTHLARRRQLLGVLVVVVTLVSAQTGLDASKPRLHPDLKELVIESGENLELRCRSSSPVRWDLPKEATETANITVYYNEMDKEEPYNSVLVLNNTHYLQTDYYRCVDNSTVDLSDESKVTSIYVYVKDESELLALEANPAPLMINSGDTLIIPCRPTAPEITVTLARDTEEINLESEEQVSFDPKIGFTYREVHLDDLEEVTCTAQRGSFISTRTFNVIHRNPGLLEAPTIHAPHHAIIGKSLEMNCSFLYEDDDPVYLSWSVPDKSGIDSKRILLGDSVVTRHIPHFEKLAIKTLKVKQVMARDEGHYTCTVKNHATSNSDQKFIRVLEEDASYINLTAQDNKTNITIEAGTVQFVMWVIYFAAHPEPKFTWMDNYDQEIVSTSNEGAFARGNYEFNRSASTLQLRIKDPGMENTGTYRLIAENKGVRHPVDLILNVIGNPVIKFLIDPNYMLNTEAKVVCTIVANPLPIIEWYFQPCNFTNFENCGSNIGEELKLENFTLQLLGKVTINSTLTIPARQSGRLRLVAQNEGGRFHEDVNFYVTDVPGGFHLDGPEETVEGEQILLHCSVSVFHFTRLISWKFNGFTIAESSRNLFISSKTSELSHQSMLVIENATKANEGEYSCVAERILNDEFSEKHLALKIVDVQAPTFESKTNLMGNVKELAETQSFTLNCFASGKPTPKIIWLKDEKPIAPKRNIDIVDDGRTLEFSSVALEDDGKYSCEASNRGGTIKRSITLSLLNKPKGVNIALVMGLLALTLLLVLVSIYLCIRVRREQKLRQQLTEAGLMHFEEGAIENLNMDLGVEDQAELLPYDHKFEFPREKLKLGKTLGSGAFGVVVKAEAYGIIDGEPVTPVAVKMVKRTADSAIIKALASELKIMVHLGRHLNVVNLLGACTKGLNKMELLVIVEYCRYGNLHNYLLKHRNMFIDQIDPSTGLIDPGRGVEITSKFPNGRNSGHSDSFKGEHLVDSKADYRSQTDSSENFATGATEATFVCMTPTGEDGFLLSNNTVQQPEWRSNYRGDYKGMVNPISTRDLLCYAFQVARGMEYLASRKVLHGDLAARNILLAENNIIKICDFGLAKSVYKDENYLKKENGPLPIKWMAIESIRDRIFSTQSDVWSFGIVLWEFFSLARTPYTGMAADEHMYKKLEDGYRMEKPPFATDDLYTLMMECWRARPTLRPSFTELVNRLGSMLDDDVRKLYFDLNEPYIQMNNRWQSESGHNDYLGMFSSPTYSNVVSPIPEEEEPLRYQNIPRGAPSFVADDSIPGYLTMKSPSPVELNDVFSPTRPGSNGGNVFKFHTPPQARRQLRDSEANDHIELRPMLSKGSRKSDSNSGHDSDSDPSSQYTAVPSSRPVEQRQDQRNPSEKFRSPNQGKLPSFSNPSYSFAPDLVTSVDNYVNYPNQKTLHSEKSLEILSNMPAPTFSTFGRKPNKDMKLPSYYVNVPSQRAPLALSEADFNDPPYIN